MVFELEQMFKIQKELQLKMNLKINNQEYINLMFIGLITEACEALENTNWKPWKKNNNFNKIELQNEIIDIWHFLINLSIAADLSAINVFEKYLYKNKINFERQKNGY